MRQFWAFVATKIDMLLFTKKRNCATIPAAKKWLEKQVGNERRKFATEIL